jgi:eukaryotic-like serine/threonine-protein kinase
MVVALGSNLGPYQILAPLGAGGMGEVYRAKDTRLDRIVAIKVLPASFASKPEHRERLDREARAIARLNHPHICDVYDVGRQGDDDFLVMEYLEGRTLADRLVAGPLPVREVFRHAIEIADALDHAHRQGIVHRDLKPGNIMLTSSGAKLLDFGLAKLRPEASIPDLSTVVTHGSPLTASGSILGTFQYMAPEQLQGKNVDSRADIFAFGAVVYEMTTGRRAFEGSTQASVIGAILHTDPPAMATLQPVAPPVLDRLVNRCLAKDPEHRWQTVRDLRFELQGIAEGVEKTGRAAPMVAQRNVRSYLAATFAVLAVLAVSAALIKNWLPARAPSSPTAPLMRFVLGLPQSAPVAVEDQSATVLAVSPDGARLVYVAKLGNNTQLYVRPLDQFQPTPLAGTEGGVGPFFSPDGQRVAFFAGGKLKTVGLDGSPPVTVCDAPTSRGGSWASDDTIVFTPGIGAGLMRVPARGGEPKKLTTPHQLQPTLTHRWPAVLPDGKWALFTLWTGVGRAEEARLALVSLESGEQRILPLEGASSPHYSRTGHVVFLRSDSVMAAPFNVDRLEVTGPAVTIAEGVASSVWGSAQFAVSGAGMLVYVAAGDVSGQHTLRWVDRAGRDSAVAVSSRVLEEPRVSPDGEHVLLTKREANVDVWAYQLARGVLTRLTSEITEDETPIWMGDGRRITFAAARRAQYRLVLWKPMDGGDEVLLLRGERADDHPHPDSWSPDGQTLALTNIRAPFEEADIWLFRPAETPQIRPFLQTKFNEGAARFSPDGRWLAYVSNESGRYEVYVRPSNGAGREHKISVEGGTEAVWARSGDELFYRSGDRMMAATVSLNPSFSVQQRRMLFEGRYVPARRLHANYDVSPDGQRFLMIRQIGQTAAPQLRVALGTLRD